MAEQIVNVVMKYYTSILQFKPNNWVLRHQPTTGGSHRSYGGVCLYRSNPLPYSQGVKMGHKGPSGLEKGEDKGHLRYGLAPHHRKLIHPTAFAKHASMSISILMFYLWPTWAFIFNWMTHIWIAPSSSHSGKPPSDE